MNRRNNDNSISIFQRIISVLLIIAIVILTTFFILMGTIVGLVIGYWRNLPSLEPLEYKESNTWKFHLEVYSDLNTVRIGDTRDYVERVLEKLDYKLVNADRPRTGEYSAVFDEESGSGVTIIGVRSFSYPRLKKAKYLVTLNFRRDVRDDSSRVASITKEDETSITEFQLEPKLLAELYGSEGTTRELVHLVDIPKSLLNAYIATEDRQFYQHWGINLKRILKVAYLNIRARRIIAGGASTITQQLARNLFDEISYEQRLSRKIKEALMAMKIERHFSKDEILERYLNLIDLGRYGSRQLYGVQQASESYFGKSVWELSIPECALLAALPKSSTRYSPIKHPERARRRRNIVLKSMLDSGFISRDEYEAAIAAPLGVKQPSLAVYEAPHFIEYIKGYLGRRYKDQLYEGLKVYTTLDIFMQEAANEAVAKGLRELDEKMKFPEYDKNDPDAPNGVDPLKYIQGALLAIEPETGYIRAMVGGRDFYISRNKLNFFNRATQAKRQAGSTFKPFVYCAALSNSQITPATIINDEPWFINTPKGRWAPENYRKFYYGPVTVRTALIKSINVATAKLMNEEKYNVGIAKTINMAKMMGIKSRLQPYPSLALGTSDVSLLEMTSAYGVWANRGIRAEPISILFVEDRDGKILEENIPRRRRVIDASLAYLMTYLMKGVLDTDDGPGWRGTGWKARKPPFNFLLPAAGKTGTTSDYVDAWFVGYIPQLVAGVWVGFDNRKNIMEGKSNFKRSGATAALPLWAYFMKRAAYHEVKDFAIPPRIRFVEIDKRTGMRVNHCPEKDIITEAFIEGTEPTRLCTEHPPGWNAEGGSN